ncbi:hypothetical protein NHH03_06585 [Stieleria sp. TO1_6]|uniref:carbonic anhydrase n=1 Tax=Stieleria tagensis TaxID=2956795 RepID=UPI00209B48C3|nr:carbonic anhydrase [Stieleria tagensis]MCO8121397.1 hypothetical protein [Stieleria tagensis]
MQHALPRIAPPSVAIAFAPSRNETLIMYRKIKLKRQVHDLRANEFGSLADLRETAESPDQNILMICCADHGLVVDDLSFTDQQHCVIVRNMAASIPGSCLVGSSATINGIQYAIRRRNVQDIIVCHHFNCLLAAHWMKPSLNPVMVGPAREFIQKAKHVVDEHYHYTNQRERLGLMVCEHTLFQLENLCSHDFVRNRLESGQLRLHGWVVDDDTARVLSFDPIEHAFTGLEQLANQDRIS